jgi:hypothetical protein
VNWKEGKIPRVMSEVEAYKICAAIIREGKNKMQCSSRDSSVNMVLDGLQSLIVTSLSSCARRQYVPTHDPDSDDDLIKDASKQVKELRRIRVEFENLMMGYIEE